MEIDCAPNMEAIFLQRFTKIYPTSHHYIVVCHPTLLNMLKIENLKVKLLIFPSVSLSTYYLKITSQTTFSNGTKSKEQIFNGNFYNGIIPFLQNYAQSLISPVQNSQNAIAMTKKTVSLSNKCRIYFKSIPKQNFARTPQNKSNKSDKSRSARSEISHVASNSVKAAGAGGRRCECCHNKQKYNSFFTSRSIRQPRNYNSVSKINQTKTSRTIKYWNEDENRTRKISAFQKFNRKEKEQEVTNTKGQKKQTNKSEYINKSQKGIKFKNEEDSKIKKNSKNRSTQKNSFFQQSSKSTKTLHFNLGNHKRLKEDNNKNKSQRRVDHRSKKTETLIITEKVFEICINKLIEEKEDSCEKKEQQRKDKQNKNPSKKQQKRQSLKVNNLVQVNTEKSRKQSTRKLIINPKKQSQRQIMNVSKEMKREEGLVMKRSMKKIELNSKKSMGSLKRVDKESRVNSKKNIVSIKTILQEQESIKGNEETVLVTFQKIQKQISLPKIQTSAKTIIQQKEEPKEQIILDKIDKNQRERLSIERRRRQGVQKLQSIDDHKREEQRQIRHFDDEYGQHQQKQCDDVQSIQRMDQTIQLPKFKREESVKLIQVSETKAHNFINNNNSEEEANKILSNVQENDKVTLQNKQIAESEKQVKGHLQGQDREKEQYEEQEREVTEQVKGLNKVQQYNSDAKQRDKTDQINDSDRLKVVSQKCQPKLQQEKVNEQERQPEQQYYKIQQRQQLQEQQREQQQVGCKHRQGKEQTQLQLQQKKQEDKQQHKVQQIQYKDAQQVQTVQQGYNIQKVNEAIQTNQIKQQLTIPKQQQHHLQNVINQQDIRNGKQEQGKEGKEESIVQVPDFTKKEQQNQHQHQHQQQSEGNKSEAFPQDNSEHQEVQQHLQNEEGEDKIDHKNDDVQINKTKQKHVLQIQQQLREENNGNESHIVSQKHMPQTKTLKENEKSKPMSDKQSSSSQEGQLKYYCEQEVDSKNMSMNMNKNRVLKQSKSMHLPISEQYQQQKQQVHVDKKRKNNTVYRQYDEVRTQENRTSQKQENIIHNIQQPPAQYLRTNTLQSEHQQDQINMNTQTQQSQQQVVQVHREADRQGNKYTQEQKDQHNQQPQGHNIQEEHNNQAICDENEQVQDIGRVQQQHTSQPQEHEEGNNMGQCDTHTVLANMDEQLNKEIEKERAIQQQQQLKEGTHQQGSYQYIERAQREHTNTQMQNNKEIQHKQQQQQQQQQQQVQMQQTNSQYNIHINYIQSSSQSQSQVCQYEQVYKQQAIKYTQQLQQLQSQSQQGCWVVVDRQGSVSQVNVSKSQLQLLSNENIQENTDNSHIQKSQPIIQTQQQQQQQQQQQHELSQKDTQKQQQIQQQQNQNQYYQQQEEIQQQEEQYKQEYQQKQEQQQQLEELQGLQRQQKQQEEEQQGQGQESQKQQQQNKDQKQQSEDSQKHTHNNHNNNNNMGQQQQTIHRRSIHTQYDELLRPLASQRKIRKYMQNTLIQPQFCIIQQHIQHIQTQNINGEQEKQFNQQQQRLIYNRQGMRRQYEQSKQTISNILPLQSTYNQMPLIVKHIISSKYSKKIKQINNSVNIKHVQQQSMTIMQKYMKKALRFIQFSLGYAGLQRLINKNNSKVAIFHKGQWNIININNIKGKSCRQLLKQFILGRYECDSIAQYIQLMMGTIFRKIRKSKLQLAIKHYAQKQRQRYGQGSLKQKIVLIVNDNPLLAQQLKAVDGNKLLVKCIDIVESKNNNSRIYGKQKYISLDEVDQAYIANIDNKMQYHTVQIDTHQPNTIELTLQDMTIYCSGNFRFIVYKEKQKNQYCLMKEAYSFLKFISQKQRQLYLLIIQPIEEEQPQKHHKYKMKRQPLTIRYVGKHCKSLNVLQSVMKSVCASACKAQDGGYQNEVNKYMPMKDNRSVKNK